MREGNTKRSRFDVLCPDESDGSETSGDANAGRGLEVRVGILNGQNAFEAVSRHEGISKTQLHETGQRLLIMGLAFYIVAIASLLLIRGGNAIAFAFASLGILLTTVGDFLKRRSPSGG